MKIATGKVVGGKIVLEGATFEEGTPSQSWPGTEKAVLPLRRKRKPNFFSRSPRPTVAKWFQRRKCSRSSRVVMAS